MWTAFAAWSAGVRVAWSDPAAMFLAVWILYATDRLLDANPLFNAPAGTELEDRHRFHHQHRKAFSTAILATAFPLLLLLHRTAEAVLHLYILLTALLGVWLFLVHARPAPSAKAHRLPKELAVGLFFPAAVFIPTVARAPASRPALVLCAVGLAILCTLNCLFIFAWEHPNDARHAHGTTQWAVNRLPQLTTAAALGILVLKLISALPAAARVVNMASLAHPTAPLAACAASSFLLLGLHIGRHRFTPNTLRALADLVLILPLPAVMLLSAVHHT